VFRVEEVAVTQEDQARPAGRARRADAERTVQAILEAAEHASRDEADILAANPRWHPEDAAERRRQFSTVDWSQMRQILVDSPAWDVRPQLGELRDRVATRFVLADPSALVPPELTESIRKQLGPASVVVLPSTTHSVFRDDFEGFMRAVDEWLAMPEARTVSER